MVVTVNKDNSRKLSSNMEDYLEDIAFLKKNKGVVRVRDISHLMNVKNSSVTAALNTLSKNKFVIHEKYGYVELTSKGKAIARRVQERHDMLIKFLTEVLRIAPAIASADACRMEHSVSPQTFRRLTKFIDFVENCPQRQRPEWLRMWNSYFRTVKKFKSKMGAG